MKQHLSSSCVQTRYFRVNSAGRSDVKYKVYGFLLPEKVTSNLGCDEVFQTFVTRICFERLVAPLFLSAVKTYGRLDE